MNNEKLIKKLSLFHDKKELLLVIFLFFIAAVPRSIELLNGNYLWGFDQGEHYNAVKEIVIDHNMTLIGTKVGGAGGFFQGPGWYYLLTIPFILGKGDPYAAMIMMFFFGIAVVILSYFSLKKNFDTKTATVAAFLIAISPGIISQSRFIWPPFPVSFLTVCYLYFFYRVIAGEKKYLPFVTFCIGLIAHFEIATAGMLIFQLALFSPILFYFKRLSMRYISYSFFSFLLTLSPLIVFDLRNNHIITNGIMKTITNENSVKMPYEWIYQNHLDVFLGNFSSTFYRGGSLIYIFVTFMLLGSFFYFKDKTVSISKKIFVSYLVISPVLLFIVFLKYGQGMWDWWILPLPIIYSYGLGIFLAYFWHDVQGKILITLLMFFFFSAYINQTYLWYKNDYPDYGGVHKIQGKKDALDYIYQDANGKPFSLFIYTPPIYTYAYDYIIWWYGQKKYGYLPGNEKKGLFYLWIEKDPSKPWTYKGWVETVINDKNVIQTITLPSDFIIEKHQNSL